MGWRDNENFKIGEMYYLRTQNSIVAIPRTKISYVSESFEHQPLLLVGAAVLIVSIFLGDAVPSFVILLVTIGIDRSTYSIIAGILASLMVLGYFISRRVGIRVASGGGNIFVVLPGKRRQEVFDRIMVDLLTSDAPISQTFEPSLESMERAIST